MDRKNKREQERGWNRIHNIGVRAIFVLLLVLVFWSRKHCLASAAEIRVLAVNGGDSSNENTFLYSAALFRDCIKNLYINGIKVKESNCTLKDNPTYAEFGSLINSVFSSAESDDLSVFYYSGHGTKTGGFVGMATKDNMNYKFINLYEQLKKVKGKKLVILDCCYSGGFLTQNVIDKNKFTVLTACSSTAYSPYFNKLHILSLFAKKSVNVTYFSNKMLKGLGYNDKNGKIGELNADTNKDKKVTISELFKYLQKKYQKTYLTTSKGKIYFFEAVPQKYGNVNFTFSKTVSQKGKVTLNKTKAVLYKSGKLVLKAKVGGKDKKASWKSSDPSVASVSSDGKVTGKKAGEVTITAQINDSSAKCRITVKNPDIKLNKKKVTLYTIGKKTVRLSAKVKGASSKVKWKSSDPSVAAVNSNGKVTAKKKGTVKITAAANGVKESCKITVREGKKIVAVSLGYDSSAVLTSNGELWTFGANYDGRLGDGTKKDRYKPVKIMDDVAQLCDGYGMNAAIKTDGSLWMWGENGNGKLGDGTDTNRYTPVKIMDDVVDVCLSTYGSAAVKKDGSLWVWGHIASNYGTVPVKLLTGVVSVSLKGYHGAAVKKDGSLWMWGSNSNGELGTGDRTHRDKPVKVLTGVKQACVGGFGNMGDMGIEEGHTAALRTNGSLWIWGCNQYGRLGIGKGSGSKIKKTKLMTGVSFVALGAFHSAAIKKDGTLWMWGRNANGQLGNGTKKDCYSPVQITLPD